MIKNEMQLNDSLKKIKKIARPQETLDLEGGKKKQREQANPLNIIFGQHKISTRR